MKSSGVRIAPSCSTKNNTGGNGADAHPDTHDSSLRLVLIIDP